MKTIIINHCICIPLSEVRRHNYKNNHVNLILKDTSMRLEFKDGEIAQDVFWSIQSFYTGAGPLIIETTNEL